MSLALPDALTTPEDGDALTLLRLYFDKPLGERGSYAGAAWDTFDPSRDRVDTTDRFTAEDIVSMFFLSARVGPVAAERLLHSQAEQFSSLLAAVGPDRNLADETEPIGPDWPGWELYTAVKALPSVGRTRASKLLARKRPRLFPIRDAVIEDVLGLDELFWEPLRLALRADDLQARLLRLREAARLPETVSALRVLDVICWMEGKQKGY